MADILNYAFSNNFNIGMSWPKSYSFPLNLSRDFWTCSLGSTRFLNGLRPSRTNRSLFQPNMHQLHTDDI